MRAPLIYVACMILAACGGSGQTSTPSQPQATTTPSVVFIGDSITERWGAIQSHGFVNAGISGNTTAQMLERFDSDVLSHHPNVIVIDGGINDIAHIPNATTDNLSRMILSAQATGVTVILCNLIPSTHWTPNSVVSDEASGQVEIKRFNSDLQLLSQAYGVTLVDYYDVMLLTDGSSDTSLFVDYIHPNDAGYARMWTKVEPALIAAGIH